MGRDGRTSAIWLASRHSVCSTRHAKPVPWLSAVATRACIEDELLARITTNGDRVSATHHRRLSGLSTSLGLASLRPFSSLIHCTIGDTIEFKSPVRFASGIAASHSPVDRLRRRRSAPAVPSSPRSPASSPTPLRPTPGFPRREHQARLHQRFHHVHHLVRAAGLRDDCPPSPARSLCTLISAAASSSGSTAIYLAQSLPHLSHRKFTSLPAPLG